MALSTPADFVDHAQFACLGGDEDTARVRPDRCL